MELEKVLKYLEKNGFSMNDTAQGGVSFVGSKRDFIAAVKEIGEDETPLAIMAGEFWFVGPGTPGKNNAIVILTNERLIFADKKIRNVDFKTFYLDDVNSVSYKTAFLSSEFVIKTTSEKIAINKVKKDTGTRFNKVLHEELKNTRKNKNSGGVAALSGMDEVRKAKTLFDEGIISKEEFDAIKAKHIG